MTAVDALDTMILMELDDEAATTKKYILDNLSFDKDIEVQNFEITIRLLGGLLTNYQLTGDKRFSTSRKISAIDYCQSSTHRRACRIATST